MGARADPNSRNSQRFGDLGSGIRGDHLENDSKSSCFLNSKSIGEQLFETVTSPLDHVTSESVLALRCKADVSHQGDAGIHDASDLFGATHTALELDCMCAGFLHKAERGVKCLVRSSLVGAERHICNDERSRDSPGDSTRERDQVINAHRQSGVVTVNVVASRIAHEQEIDSRFVKDSRGQLVVAGEANDIDTVLFRRLKVASSLHRCLRASSLRSAESMSQFRGRARIEGLNVNG